MKPNACVSFSEVLTRPGTEGELHSPKSTRNSVRNSYVCEWAGAPGFCKKVLRDSFLSPAMSGTSSIVLPESKLIHVPRPWDPTPVLLLQMSMFVCEAVKDVRREDAVVPLSNQGTQVLNVLCVLT